MIFSIFEATLIEDFGDKLVYWPAEKLAPLSHIECASRLTFKVKPNQDEHIRLSTGERLQDIDGKINIYRQVESLQEGEIGIGAMIFMAGISREYPDPSSPDMYFIEVKLPPLQFDGLVEAARNGRIPKWIIVNARGMELPDEFSLTWDVKSSPSLHIAAISFSIPLAIGETILKDDVLIEPTQLQVSNLSQEVGALSTAMRGINKKLQWILGVLIFLLVAVLEFKH